MRAQPRLARLTAAIFALLFSGSLPAQGAESAGLPFAASEKAPAAPSGCDAGPWQDGFAEAVAGKRFLIAVSPKQMPLPAESKGCSSYRGGSEREQPLLRCCTLGFFEGMKALHEKLSKAELELGDTPVNDCRKSLEQGKEHARIACEALGCARPGKHSYLGCYTLGYASQYQDCAQPEGEKLKAYLKKYGIAISEQKNKSVRPHALSSIEGTTEGSSSIDAR